LPWLGIIPFKLSFAVPVEGADEMIVLLSNISWVNFRAQLADTLGIAPKAVHIAYRFSTDARNARYIHLKTEENLKELFHTEKKTLIATRSKKAFAVEIKDLDDQGGKPTKSTKSAKPSKKKKVRNLFVLQHNYSRCFVIGLQGKQ
jgi:hypothetical protein